MERLVERLMRFLAETLGWRRALLVVQDEAGTVSWSLQPVDLPLSIRANTDDSLSVTLGIASPAMPSWPSWRRCWSFGLRTTVRTVREPVRRRVAWSSGATQRRWVERSDR